MEFKSDPVVIRGARPEDAMALVGLLGELGFPSTAEIVEERLSSLVKAGEIVLVAQQGQEVVGLVTVHVTPVLHRPTPVGRITALVVAERARGHGVGRALVASAERVVASRGCALMEVTSNLKWRDAHGFYERLGFEVTSLRFRKVIGPGEVRKDAEKR